MTTPNQGPNDHTAEATEPEERFAWEDDRSQTTAEPDQAAGEPQPGPEAVKVADQAAELEVDRESLRRALRDLEAAKARVERDKKRVYDDTRAQLVSEVLPVLDNLDRTVRAIEGQCDAGFVDGVKMVESQLERVLGRLGLERIDAEGKQFNPHLHEAMSMVPVIDRSFDGLVLQQLEPGYKYADRLLRAAKVVVGKLQH